MFPIILDVMHLAIALVGNGNEVVRRLKKLDESGAKHVVIYADKPNDALIKSAGSRLIHHMPMQADIENVAVVMIAGLSEDKSSELADMARKVGRLVNVEDDKKLCDFHFPALVRRGDLLLTISTGGKSPTLARRIRELLENMFEAKWAEQLNEIGLLRQKWQQKGLGFHDLISKSDAHIDDKGWLSCLKLNIKK